MASPVVLPKTPIDSTSSLTSLHGKYILTLDDTDSSIRRGSAHITGFYSSLDESTYDHTSKQIGNFRDTGANPFLADSVSAFSYQDDRIELEVVDADGNFNSALFFPVKSNNTDGCAFSFRLNFNSHSVVGSSNTPRPYYTSQNFTGVSAGLFDFSTGNAVILFFDDGGSITVAGPASDGNATRVTSPINYDWTNETTYTIFMDYKIDEAVVTATQNESGDDFILYKGSLSALGVCLESVGLAGRFKDQSTDLIPFVSQDGRVVGDTLTIHRFSVLSRAYKYMSYGSFTKYSKDQTVTTRDSLLFTKNNVDTRLEGWELTGVTPYTSGEHTAFEFGATYGHAKQAFSDLDNDTFVLVLDCYATEFGFSGVNTGLGIDILGNKSFKIRFLDGAIGIRTTSNVALIRQYQGYDYTPVEVSVDNRFLLSSDGVTFRLHVYNRFIEKYELKVSTAISALPANSEENCVRFVAELGSSGVFFASNFVFSATGVPLVATNSTLAQAVNIQQGSYSFAVATPQKDSEDRFVYNPGINSISGTYGIISNYSAEDSGLTCVVKGALANIFPVPAGTYNGPFVVMNTREPSGGSATHGIHLCYTVGTDGRHYLFFPGDTQDSEEVAYQTNKGKSISFEIDSPLSLFYCLRFVPNLGFWVYDLNDNMKEVFHTPWEDIDGVRQVLPDPNEEGIPFPVDSANNNQFSAAVGVLDLNSLMKATIELFFVGTGRGLDIAFYKDTDQLPALGIYGNRSRILVTVEDND